ncbi:hypothetical protein CXB51_028571 [Gossypium anomalum]|uniref:DUF4218 domain-containing protein n=1 Tax=Gossypium anomalum TaxID=47600 RepID=A0A8J6CPR2_9ROSI|nr:hypothetical protein CXB51_028571 [Gossypium anomalum]
MDKSWTTNLSRVSNDYRNGLQTFPNFAFQNASQETMILYPCKKCGNINWHFREVVYEHLIVDGFIRGYKKWIFHGEYTPSRTSSMINPTYPYSAYHQSVTENDMEGMLRDAFNMHSHGLQSFPPDFIAFDDYNIGGNAFTKTGRTVPDEEPNREAAKFYKILNEMNEELYEGSKYSKMHPVDSLAWKSFDSKFPSFATDLQNVRLGLASDGFNPYKIMSTSYSIWPVVLVPYNLPSWICVKQSCVETYDVLRKENFYLRAALLWTINDFPAYVNISSWSTKGRYACPCYAAQTYSKWLYNGKKFSYMGIIEFREAPKQTIGSEILFMLKDINFSYGKMNQPQNTQTKRRPREACVGDVDEQIDDESDKEDDLNKNVCENIIGTILNVDRKLKDNLQSRLDLVDMGIWRELHPQVLLNGKYRLLPSIFVMSKKEKEVLCTVLEDIKVMSCIIELSNIMKAICGKVLNVEELEKLQDQATLTLCNLEKIFPPSFFTIMVHLVIHLPHEAKFGGLVWSGKDVNDEVKWFSQGSNRVVKRYTTFLINGFRFHTKSRERLRRTQNCGIVVNSSITSYASTRDSNPVEGNVEYYGLLTEIIELDYYRKRCNTPYPYSTPEQDMGHTRVGRPCGYTPLCPDPVLHIAKAHARVRGRVVHTAETHARVSTLVLNSEHSISQN